ncbi:DUF1665 domain-containing protein [Cordyceps javanica]|uniref:DUF1665 domain-containing protein n=1 Tax=Cordyceps javanica TaxID=43265 RepID=A0A545W310_9HYPO|nr:DUF1665 domain-containing protein [Cordyceps javanica]TQW08378.1 hypothetical protein IF2G_04254 [Cordyceps javanica]
MTAFKYPGFDLDLRCIEREGYPLGFPNAKGGESKVLQIREVAMMMLMDQITDKPNWHEKVFNEEIVQKWRQGAAEQPEAALFARIMEGKESARIRQPPKIITARAFEYARLIPTLDSSRFCVVKSDLLFSESLRLSLVKAFDILRADQAEDIDWHPQSNDMVQNLVHPSMYPFVYGQGGAISQPFKVNRGRPADVADQYWSRKFQWLPCNASFQDNGSVRITSYINNLHPVRYQGIYQTIEKAIAAAIPLWDQCLQEYEGYDRMEITGRSKSRFKGIAKADDEDVSLWSDFDMEYFLTADMPVSDEGEKSIANGYFYGPRHFYEAVEAYQKLKTGKVLDLASTGPELNHDPTALVEEKRAYRKWLETRVPLYPEPLPFEEIDYAPEESIRTIYEQDGLQVIVKMASIELTPEKPEFPAGGWHLEGMMNEKIVATALFYLDSENVTESHVAFRAQTSPSLSGHVETGQDAYNWLENVHGTCLGHAYAQCWQPYGDVKTPQGRILAFPNTLQHRVSPLKLQDPSKPGHRRFLALWLVDPHVRVISTANVPPQQTDWWEKSSPAPAGLMTREEAREQRLALMKERSIGQHDLDHHWRSVQYSFCEH